MKECVRHIVSAVAAALAMLAAWACSSDLADDARTGQTSAEATFNDDGTIGLTIGMEIPEMTSAATRTMNATPDYDALSLYMFVFEQGEGLKQYARIESAAGQTPGTDGVVKFRVTLEPTEKSAVVHIVATDQPDFEQQIVYGMEDRVIGSLCTDGGHEAYWQRIELGSNIPSAEEAEKYPDEKAKVDAIAAKLNRVPVIRNFCRVSVYNSARNFTLTGLYVVNTVDRGSAAPYAADRQQFMVYCDGPAADGRYTGRSYADISSDGYVGTLPAGVTLINKIDRIETRIESGQGQAIANGSAIYFYERPARTSSSERTYAILRGRMDGKQNDTYYKIDIGRIRDDDVVGIFEYYNLLRNFDYAIRLNTVESEGYKTLDEAAGGAVFNNFSASVEARNMNSISDGDDMIQVNFTSFVFTLSGQTVNLLAQFRENITDGKAGSIRNDLLEIKWEAGEVISSIAAPKTETKDGTQWNSYEVTAGENAGAQLKQQTVYVYRGKKSDGSYGLYREVIFFSHEPWSFVHMDTFPGLWESMDEMPDWEWSNEKREIGQSKGSPLTLFFELPAGLPQTLFPLKFYIESDRQNIQNAYQGNAVVRSVPASESLFNEDPTLGKPTTARIQYVKTVTWEDYYGETSDELVGTGSAIVRCRFLTITDLAQDGIGGAGQTGQSTTTLRVYNEYFGRKIVDAQGNVSWKSYHQDGFERNTETSDPSPRFWDFNSGIWDDILTRMSSRYGESATDYLIYTADNNSTDELIFVDGTTVDRGVTKPTLNTGRDNDGRRYVQTTAAGDMMKHKHTYSNTKRTIRVEVESTDDAGRPAAPQIAVTNVKGGTIAAPGGYKEFDADKGLYVYEFVVPEAVTALDVDVKPAADNPSMRFYKVNLYPRWGDFGETADAAD